MSEQTPFYGIDMGGQNFKCDTILESSAATGVTADSVLLKDGSVSLIDTGTVGESTGSAKLAFEEVGYSTLPLITSSASIAMTQRSSWIGVGSSSPRIEFDGTDGHLDIQSGTLDLNNNGIIGVNGIIIVEDGYVGISTGNERLVFDGTGGLISVYEADFDLNNNNITNASNVYVTSGGTVGISGDSVITFSGSGFDFNQNSEWNNNAISGVGALTITSGIDMGEDTYIGIASNAERFVFDGTAGSIDVVGAYLSAGTGTPEEATSEGDIYATDILETGGDIRCYGGSIFLSSPSSTSTIDFLESGIQTVTFAANHGADQFLLGLESTVGRQLVICERSFTARDFDHAVQTNPTVYIQSATDPNTNNTQWVSLAHDQTNAVFGIGTGVYSITGGHVLIASTNQVQLGDSGTYIYQRANSYLSLVADGAVEVFGILELEASTSATGHITQAGTRILHTYGTNNFFAGAGAGNFTLSAAEKNTGVGRAALDAITNGDDNTGLGYGAGSRVTSGVRNTSFGSLAGWGVITTDDTTAFGANALGVNEGPRNVAVGNASLYTDGAGDCVGIGYQAGYYETAANKLFIDNASRANEADGRVKALIYGVFDALTANQSVTINGALNVREDSLMISTAKWTFQDAATHIYSRVDSELNIVTDGAIRVGTATVNYSQFEADGTLSFVGAATVWDDIRVSISSIKRLGFSDPGWVKFADDGAGSTGVYALAFAAGTDEEVYFTVQLPHSYKEGSDITPHVHWAPSDANAGNVTWKLEYTWINIDGTFGNTSTGNVTDSTDSTSHKHLKAIMSAITGTSKTISSMLACRLYRDVSDGDDYGSDAFLLEVDFHFEIDTVGSRAALTK